MRYFIIYKVNDDYTKKEYCCTETARFAKTALRNYAKELMNSGIKSIIYNEYRKEYELVTSYGACFIAEAGLHI